MKYREMKPVGKCEVCTISLWKEHNNKPAPHTLPCVMDACPNKTNAKVVPFEQSQVGSSLNFDN